MDPKLNRPKKHHTVPQAYLKRFSHNGGKHVHVFDKLESRPFDVAVGDVCTARGFHELPVVEGRVFPEGTHTNILEELMSHVESEYAEDLALLIESAGNSPVIDQELRRRLSKHFGIQWFRGIQSRSEIEKIYKNMIEHLIRFGDYEIAPGVKCLDVAKVQIDEDYVKSKHLLGMFDQGLWRLFGHFFFERHWAIWTNQTELPLYTSDNPINSTPTLNDTFNNNGHLGARGNEISIPLTPRMLLCVVCPSIAGSQFTKNIVCGDMRLGEVMRYNHIQFNCSGRQVVVPDGRYDLCRDFESFRDKEKANANKHR